MQDGLADHLTLLIAEHRRGRHVSLEDVGGFGSENNAVGIGWNGEKIGADEILDEAVINDEIAREIDAAGDFSTDAVELTGELYRAGLRHLRGGQGNVREEIAMAFHCDVFDGLIHGNGRFRVFLKRHVHVPQRIGAGDDDVCIHQHQIKGLPVRELMDENVPGIGLAASGEICGQGGECMPEGVGLLLLLEEGVGEFHSAIRATIGGADDLHAQALFRQAAEEGLTKEGVESRLNGLFFIPRNDADGNMGRVPHVCVRLNHNCIHIQ